MAYLINPEDQDLLDSVREFCEKEIKEQCKEYDVSGCTALYDAVGGAIRHIRNIHRYIRPEDVPDHTLFVITTDGLENASTRFTLKDVRRLIEERKEKGRSGRRTA